MMGGTWGRGFSEGCYSKKLLVEHVNEIVHYKAAKKYYGDAGLKKLPAIKGINSEYVGLIAKKKTAYAEQRKARDEMKKMLTVKANVYRIFIILLNLAVTMTDVEIAITAKATRALIHHWEAAFFSSSDSSSSSFGARISEENFVSILCFTPSSSE